jgi:hypothetical protein
MTVGGAPRRMLSGAVTCYNAPVSPIALEGRPAVSPTVLFLGFLMVIAIVLFAIWRYWSSLARVTPEEEEFDERMAALNERQANRLSDDQLTQPFTDEEAWQIMVRRGLRDRDRQRPPRRRTGRLLSPPRQERYGGDMRRRIEERRERYGDPTPRDDDRKKE